ncbi:MAG: hypothetical protein GY828_05035 [Candidatus Gracilibacteria bacterium]|nr:hypothetical protein [Candidatus Gracilibacteria bacterium]
MSIQSKIISVFILMSLIGCNSSNVNNENDSNEDHEDIYEWNVILPIIADSQKYKSMIISVADTLSLHDIQEIIVNLSDGTNDCMVDSIMVTPNVIETKDISINLENINTCTGIDYFTETIEIKLTFHLFSDVSGVISNDSFEIKSILYELYEGDIIEFYPQNAIQQYNPETGKLELKLPYKNLDVDYKTLVYSDLKIQLPIEDGSFHYSYNSSIGVNLPNEDGTMILGGSSVLEEALSIEIYNHNTDKIPLDVSLVSCRIESWLSGTLLKCPWINQ